MTEQQVRLLLLKASAAYPNQLELTPEILAVWVERLIVYPADKALEHLNNHIDTSRFFPTIADILRLDPGVNVDYEKQRIETRERLDGLRLLEARNPISPERLAEIERAAKAGEYDEMFKDDPYLGRRKDIGD